MKTVDRVISNMKRMLHDRNYRIENEDDQLIDYVFEPKDSDIEEGVSGMVRIVTTGWTSDGKEKVCCIVHDDVKESKSFGIDSVRKYLPFLKHHGYHLAIFLVNAKVTPQAYTTANKSSIHCEFFMFDSLTYIVVDHRKVPRYSLVPKLEIQGLLAQLKVETPQNLPKMLKRDPISKYYGYRPGDVIRVESSSRENGSTVRYTFVI